ncbi:hypothetical protein [Plantibacter flavus]|nr:hypothetical protein [Plantibacter flavus]
MKPFVKRLDMGLGIRPWWSFTQHDVQAFESWQDAYDHALASTQEVTA